MNGSGLRRMVRRLSSSRTVIAVTMCALVASAIFGTGALLVARANPDSAGPRVTLQGHLVPALRHAKVLRATDGGKTLHLDIVLAPRNQGTLHQLLAAQNNQNSPLYHRYLTSQQYQQQFSPSQATVDALTQFLNAQGLTVGKVSANRAIIQVSGSVSTIEQALGVKINDYQLGKRVVYGPANEPTLPAQLAATVTGIVGLDNVAVYQNHTQRPNANAPRLGGGPNGGYTPAELRAAYNMNPLISSYNGTGQTVAIFELDSYNPSDINTYLSHYGLGSAKYSNVVVDGASTTPGDGAIEVELDMETVSAISPGASQKIYIGPNTDQGVIDTYNQIVTDNTAKVVSTSWGLCEHDSASSTMSSEDTIFAQAAAQGQTIFAAAGDAGAYDCANDPYSDWYGLVGTTYLNVDNPADDPNVVGVGGTKMFLNGSDNGYGSESVWDWYDEAPVGVYIYGGGGGFSQVYTRPSYQSGPGVSSTNQRQVPDVSADADPDTGYSVYCTAGSNCSGQFSGWSIVGGTSAAAPLWAGIAADINQYLGAHSGLPSLGNANGLLYYLFNSPQPYAAYHDITVGKNIYYSATSGYDVASGAGTPDVWNLARDAEAAGLHLAVPPLISSVAIDGTQNLPAQTFTIQNTGFGTINWTATNVPAWVTLSSSSGSLTNGASQTLTASFNFAQCTPTSGPNSEQACSGTITFNAPGANDAVTTVPVTAVTAQVSKTWYFAEGFTGSGATEYLTIANPAAPGSGVTANVMVTYLLGPHNGTPQSPIVKHYSIPAGTRFTQVVNNDVGYGQNVSMVITSDQAVVAERPYYVIYRGSFGSVPGSSDVLGATSLATQFDFGYVDTSTNHDTWLTILNNNASSMTATIQYFPAAGGTPITIPHTVPANSRGTVYVNGESGLPHGVYSALVSLSAPGLVERPLYMLHDSVTGYPGSADVVGVAQPQTNWYFAEGYASSLVNERYILANPTTASGTVNATVTFYRADGSSVPVNVTLNPGQQQVVVANTYLGNNKVDNSAVVTASAPILAERLMSFTYFGSAGVNRTITVQGASEVLGASAPAPLAYFAEGYTGGYVGDYLTIENPSLTATATIQVSFLPQNGSPATVQTYVIGPHSRFTLYSNTVMPNQWFAMSIVSTVPVVAERPMYFNYNGSIPGGTDVVGYQP
ncbi:MAG TPA: S53 family peptidase [Ktedonobacterales bacterium]